MCVVLGLGVDDVLMMDFLVENDLAGRVDSDALMDGFHTCTLE